MSCYRNTTWIMWNSKQLCTVYVYSYIPNIEYTIEVLICEDIEATVYLHTCIGIHSATELFSKHTDNLLYLIVPTQSDTVSVTSIVNSFNVRQSTISWAFRLVLCCSSPRTRSLPILPQLVFLVIEMHTSTLCDTSNA